MSEPGAQQRTSQAEDATGRGRRRSVEHPPEVGTPGPRPRPIAARRRPIGATASARRAPLLAPLLASLLAGLSLGGCALFFGRAERVIYDTSVVTVHARLDGFHRQGLAEDLAFAQDVAAHFTGLPGPAPGTRPRLYVVGDDPLLRRHREGPDHGFAVRDTPSGAYYLVDGRRRLGQTRRGLLQAMLHLHLSSGPVPAPAWYQIGFGAVMDTLEWSAGRLAVGRVDPVRLRQLRQLERFRITSLIEPGFLARLPPRERRGYEAVAWLAVHHLTVDVEGQSGAPPRDRLDQYMAALALGASPAEALEAAWGLTPRQLANRVRARATGQLRVPHISLDAVPRRTPVPVPRTPAPARVARALGRLHAAFGERDRALAAFEEALRLDPEDALAWAAASRLKVEDGDLVGARADAERAVALAPDAPEALIARALVTIRRADRGSADADAPGSGAQARTIADAREALGFGLAVDPDDPELLWALAETWRSIPDQPLDPAIEALERAHALHPADRRIRLALLDAHARRGNRRDARRVAANLLTDARTREQVSEVETLLAPVGGLVRAPWHAAAVGDP